MYSIIENIIKSGKKWTELVDEGGRNKQGKKKGMWMYLWKDDNFEKRGWDSNARYKGVA